MVDLGPLHEEITVTVRWTDGYIETFKCTEVRFGHALLWMRLKNGSNRHISLSSGNVRWYSVHPESHEPS